MYQKALKQAEKEPEHKNFDQLDLKEQNKIKDAFKGLF